MLTIRPARPEDAAAMLDVHHEAILSKAAGHYTQASLNEWAVGQTPERIARFEKQIADPALVILVAEAASKVVGFAVAVPASNKLRSLCVEPNAVGRVGGALLGEIERRAFETSPVLTCDASLNAVGFYRAHGYTEEGPGGARPEVGRKHSLRVDEEDPPGRESALKA